MTKEKLTLTDDGKGFARKSYTDQDGLMWLETDTSGYLDENECPECGVDSEWTITCMDGGECYCRECLDKLFDVTWQ